MARESVKFGFCLLTSPGLVLCFREGMGEEDEKNKGARWKGKAQTANGTGNKACNEKDRYQTPSVCHIWIERPIFKGRSTKKDNVVCIRRAHIETERCANATVPSPSTAPALASPRQPKQPSPFIPFEIASSRKGEEPRKRVPASAILPELRLKTIVGRSSVCQRTHPPKRKEWPTEYLIVLQGCPLCSARGFTPRPLGNTVKQRATPSRKRKERKKSVARNETACRHQAILPLCLGRWPIQGQDAKEKDTAHLLCKPRGASWLTRTSPSRPRIPPRLEPPSILGHILCARISVLQRGAPSTASMAHRPARPSLIAPPAKDGSRELRKTRSKEGPNQIGRAHV